MKTAVSAWLWIFNIILCLKQLNVILIKQTFCQCIYIFLKWAYYSHTGNIIKFSSIDFALKDFPFWANLRLILSIDFKSRLYRFNWITIILKWILFIQHFKLCLNLHIAQRYFDISSSNGRLLSWITSITLNSKFALLSTRSIISPENSICSVLSSLISIETPFLHTKCAVTLFITLLKESCQQLPTAFYLFF